MSPDEDLVRRLRLGDEIAFREVIRRHHARLLGLAKTFVGNGATAEEVVQDTWLAVIEGIGRLDQPSSLKSWIYTILANKARRRAARDRRISLFADMSAGDEGAPAVDPSRFTHRGFWTDTVALWDLRDPERIVAGRQIWAYTLTAIDNLPPRQKAVVLLRDVEGLNASDACEILGIAESHQRVLLHRGRAKLRQAIEEFLTGAKR